MRVRPVIPWLTVAAVVLSASCRLLTSPFAAARPAPHRITTPVLPNARLAVSWIGHATALVQIDDRVILTDPVFTQSVGVLSRRLTATPIAPEDLPTIDVALVSHMHFDHLSLGSLEMLQDKIRRLYVPEGGLVYLTDLRLDALDLAPWESVTDASGVEITAVPVKHNGMRYGADIGWMRAFTGWVVRYHGVTVYFGGDTAYDPEHFKETRAHFPHIDVALLPISPIHPRGFMGASHMEPYEAVSAMLDLGAARMVPVHFDTFVNSSDTVGEAPDGLLRAARMKELDTDRIALMEIGEQRVILSK
jgi:L-ascorbate metabolism protein UlaG (beta-lactamase superfamily)